MGQDKIAWIDVETTGLDVATGHLLEVACIMTGPGLAQEAEPFHATIRYPASQAAQMRLEADPVVRQMHDQTGLWSRLTHGTPLAEAEAGLLAYIRQVAPEWRQARLGGNSVALDMQFLKVHMPLVAAHLHYRVIDVSSIQAVATWWLGPKAEMPKAHRHEALSDIRESITQLGHLRRFFIAPTVSRSTSPRVLVTGDERWADADQVQGALLSWWLDQHQAAEPVLVTSGAERGAEAMAEACWQAQGFPVERHPALAGLESGPVCDLAVTQLRGLRLSRWFAFSAAPHLAATVIAAKAQVPLVLVRPRNSNRMAA